MCEFESKDCPLLMRINRLPAALKFRKLRDRVSG
jgi:hypothetical protein